MFSSRTLNKLNNLPPGRVAGGEALHSPVLPYCFFRVVYFMAVISEAATKEQFIKYFSEWFNIRPEVTSECKAGRIDIVMYHKTDMNKEYPFGLELKRKDVKRGTELGAWMVQANGYTKLKFNNQSLRVFVYPQISDRYLKEGSDISQHNVYEDGINGWHYNVNSFLFKAFGIGELQKYKNWKKQSRCRLVINTYPIWDSNDPWRFNIDKLKVL